MGHLLTAKEIKDSVLDPKQKNVWLPHFENHEFEKLPHGKLFGIEPFSLGNLGPVSLDLTVGPEVFSLRRGEKVLLSRDEKPNIEVHPGESVLVLTKEFLALSPKVAGITLSRARVMNEGVTLSSAKIDPTWYGRLQIPITNNARTNFRLGIDQPFCTILLFELDQPVKEYLALEKTPHLGQTTLQYHPVHATPWLPRNPNTVRDEDMAAVVSSFGAPFDIVQGMLSWNKTQIITHLEKEWSPNVLKDLKQSIWAEEFRQIQKYHDTEIGLLKQQVELFQKNKKTEFAQAFALVLAILGWMATMVAILVKLFTP